MNPVEPSAAEEPAADGSMTLCCWWCRAAALWTNVSRGRGRRLETRPEAAPTCPALYQLTSPFRVSLSALRCFNEWNGSESQLQTRIRPAGVSGKHRSGIERHSRLLQAPVETRSRCIWAGAPLWIYADICMPSFTAVVMVTTSQASLKSVIMVLFRQRERSRQAVWRWRFQAVTRLRFCFCFTAL